MFKGDRLELVIHIADYYGLRRGEIIGLKWDSIDFDKKTITIRRKVSGSYLTGKGEILHVENELKTTASVRTFPLIPHIEKLLKERKHREEQYSKLLGEDFDRTYDGFVCRDNTGKLISPNYASRHFKLVLDQNKLKPMRFHDLRHLNPPFSHISQITLLSQKYPPAKTADASPTLASAVKYFRQMLIP